MSKSWIFIGGRFQGDFWAPWVILSRLSHSRNFISFWPFFSRFVSCAGQKWAKVEFSSEVKSEMIFELPGSSRVVWAIVEIPFRFGVFSSISVRFWTGGLTKNFIYQKLSRIENGVSGRFLHFVWTRINSLKLEPVAVSLWKDHPKIYFFMLSNFCFMEFFDSTAHNGAIAVWKTEFTDHMESKSTCSSVIWPRIKKCHSSKSV